jgi:peptidoglycan hydrolase-like protein with peptidoglycan-binding domain
VKKVVVFAVAIWLAVVSLVSADDNVREVQTKLSDEGFYFGEIDGAYSSDLSAALSRYQIRNGLPINGQLDVETSKALGAKPAVGPSTAATEQSSETWRRLRKGERQTMATTNARARSTARTSEAPRSNTGTLPQESPQGAPPIAPESTEPVSPQPPTAADASSSAANVSVERLKDYVGAFVLAGLDPRVGAEADFFADRVHYYDQGTMSREKIREDLKRYAQRWPDRRFWIAGEIKIEREDGNRTRVTFPLRYELRNGAKHSSGKIYKTLVLEPAGDDFEIVSVNELKTD